MGRNGVREEEKMKETDEEREREEREREREREREGGTLSEAKRENCFER